MVDAQKLLGATQGAPIRNPWQAGNAFDTFLTTWTPILHNREINFSIHIRPDQKVGAAIGAANNFNNDPHVLYDSFVIAVP
jgi:hypothetical protein